MRRGAVASGPESPRQSPVPAAGSLWRESRRGGPDTLRAFSAETKTHLALLEPAAGASAARLGGEGAEGTASGVPQEAFQPGDLDFPQISAPARAPRPLFVTLRKHLCGSSLVYRRVSRPCKRRATGEIPPIGPGARGADS